jgi:hypothetical protein
MAVLTAQTTAGGARPDPRSQPLPPARPAPGVVLRSPSDNNPRVHALDGRLLQARHTLAPLCVTAQTRDVLVWRTSQRAPVYRQTTAEVTCKNCLRLRDEPRQVAELAKLYGGGV